MTDNEKNEILNQIRKVVDEFNKISIIFDEKNNSFNLSAGEPNKYAINFNRASKILQELEDKLNK